MVKASVGRKLIGTTVVRSFAVCAAQDDSVYFPRSIISANWEKK